MDYESEYTNDRSSKFQISQVDITMARIRQVLKADTSGFMSPPGRTLVKMFQGYLFNYLASSELTTRGNSLRDGPFPAPRGLSRAVYLSLKHRPISSSRQCQTNTNK